MIKLNKIYNENCIKTLSKIPDNSIGVTLTSPPYDNIRKYSGFSFDFEKIANELYRVTKSGGVVVWNVADATINGSETGTSFKQALYFKEIGFNIHDTQIFAKNNPPPLTHNRYDPAFEYLFVFSKGKPNIFNPILEECKNAGKYINRKSNIKALKESKYVFRCRNQKDKIKKYKYHKNIWYYNVGNGNSGEHPAPFPIEMARDNILSWSKEGDIVFDPFLGSGTTALAAKQLNRRFIGSEISKKYWKYANSRLSI